jgi:ribosomal protein L23
MYKVEVVKVNVLLQNKICNKVRVAAIVLTSKAKKGADNHNN